MNEIEAAELLGRIAHVDRNAAKPSTDLAIGWAALLDDIELADALLVVRDHYRRTADNIAPSDIVAGVRAAHRAALDKAAVPAQAPDPDLMRRLEALADSKAVDRDTEPVQLIQRPGRRAIVGQRAVADAMRRGEQARAAHQRQLEAGEPAAEAAEDAS